MITLDARYPMIVSRAAEAISNTVAGVKVCRHRVPGAVAVSASHPIWPIALPQHGVGRKHKRRIALTCWQMAITKKHPQDFLRGLLHSDGSRCQNNFSVDLPSGRIAQYSYTRYFFTNLSTDIQRIFCDHCDLLGIRWTQCSFKNISVAQKDSVAALDAFVGPKR